MNSVHLEWRDCINNWDCTMDFCHVPLPRYSASWSAHRSRKELIDSAEVRLCFRAHRMLHTDVLMAQSDHVLMEKMVFDILRSGAVLSAISVSGDARTGMRHPKIGEML